MIANQSTLIFCILWTVWPSQTEAFGSLRTRERWASGTGENATSPQFAVSVLRSLESEGQRAKAGDQKTVLHAGMISRKTSMGSNYCYCLTPSSHSGTYH